MDREILNNTIETKLFLRKMRNDIVGSAENKIEYLNNKIFLSIFNHFIEISDNTDTETLSLIISILNSFLLTNFNDINSIILDTSILTQKIIKLIPSSYDDVNFIECCLRFLKTLSVCDLLSIDKCFKSGFMDKIENYLLNDVCYNYILIILEKICLLSYYKHFICQNNRLVEKMIDKLFQNKNKHLIKHLLSVINLLIEDQDDFARKIYEMNIMQIIPSYIRFYEDNIKISAISLMVSVLSKSYVSFENEPMIGWSVSILLNLIKQDNNIANKIRSINVLTLINKKGNEMQNIFYNLEGVDFLLQELKNLHLERIKEIDETVKSWKSNKNKKDKFTDESVKIENLELDENGKYKIVILECLASSSSVKEESRRKIIDSKELNIILYSLEDNNSKIVQSSANVILSLSRAHLSAKKYLNEYDITSLLFKLTSHNKIEIQITSTNTLCNFLLDSNNNMNEIIEYVNKLLKIFVNTKHSKIRYNSVCAIKNIVYYSSSQRDIKKNIMKKFTYELLLTLLDDEDILIQEQALLIFRGLVYNTAEDVEDVFTACKVKFLKKIEEKLNSQNYDIVSHSLYILFIISNTNVKHRSIFQEYNFINKISEYVEFTEKNIRNPSIHILNNIFTNSDSFNEWKTYIKEYNLIPKLEKISSEEEDDYDIKGLLANILGQIKKK